MSRDGTRPLAAFIAAVLAVGLLAACGGSDSSSSDSTSAGAPSGSSATTDTTVPSDQHGGSSEGGTKQGSGGQNDSHSQSHQGGGNGSSSRTPAEVETPLKVSGGGAAQFRSKGGDNSIQEFGGEAGEAELREAAEVVHGFYVSRAAEEWDKACSYLAKSNAEQLEQLVSQASKGKGGDCATALEAFTQPLPVAVEREITTVDAGSLRHEGEQGFLIYFGADRVKYAMPLKDEGGSWKVAALSGTTLG